MQQTEEQTLGQIQPRLDASTSGPESLVLWLDELDRDHLHCVGRKALNLGLLKREGFSVPEGFVITTSAFESFKAANNLDNRINSIIDVPTEAEDVSQAVSKLIMEAEIPPPIVDSIKLSYERLADKSLHPNVAVRSSSLQEDELSYSFAGQHESLLGCLDFEQLIRSTKECWKSLWSTRAIRYRREIHLNQKDLLIAVLVQRLVPSRISVVVFTANPVSGNLNEAVVNSSYGLGPSIVSGKTEPDHFVVNKNSFEVIQSRLGAKNKKLTPDDLGRLIWADADQTEAQRASLTHAQIQDLVRIGIAIEAYFHQPQDIELALDNKPYVVQARPITSRVISRGSLPVYSRTNIKEIAPDALEPLALSVFQLLLDSVIIGQFTRLGFRPSPDVKPTAAFRSRLYLNLSTVAAIAYEALGFLPESISEMRGGFDRRDLGLPRLTVRKRVAILMRIFRAFYIQRSLERSASSIFETIRSEKQSHSEKLSMLGLAELSATYSSIWEKRKEYATAHSLMSGTVMAYYRLLTRLGKKWFPNVAPSAFSDLLSGLPGVRIFEQNELLWSLSQEAKKEKLVLNFLKTFRPESRPALDIELRNSAFIKLLESFLDDYGYRGPDMVSLFSPRWRDDPTQLLLLLEGYVNGTIENPSEKLRSQQSLRLGTESRIYSELSKNTLDKIIPLKRLIFRILLHRLQKFTVLRENSKDRMIFIFDFFAHLTLEIGRQLREIGLINDAKNIAYVRLDELTNILAGKISQEQVKEIVKFRKNEFLLDDSIAVPDVLVGELTSEGTIMKNESNVLGSVLFGQGVSSGVAIGRTRVIFDSSGFKELRKDEIVVARTIEPDWVNVFAVAGGIIVESGGMLSHSAIIAREYGLPAVMGIQNATTAIRDGSLVRLDGSVGKVTFIDS